MKNRHSNQRKQAWNPKQPFINGCLSWMIPISYIENGCFTKHPFINSCLGFQEVTNKQIASKPQPIAAATMHAVLVPAFSFKPPVVAENLGGVKPTYTSNNSGNLGLI